MRQFLLTSALVIAAFPAFAENMTTAAEVKPILEATKGSWIAVREYDGRDLLYFTHLLAWRCGLESVEYSVNGADFVLWDMEPCYEDEASPSAMKDADRLPFISTDLKSIETIVVKLSYDDGTTDEVSFERASVLIP